MSPDAEPSNATAQLMGPHRPARGGEWRL